MHAKRKQRASFKAGMYLLETLTSGMYNEPFSIYREYIQNAVDSIDLLCHKYRRNTIDIRIDLDPMKRRIRIIDNGLGIPIDVAEKTLSSIGSSDKTGNKMRGFRGIGRLGGVAFCDKALFRTKSKGEIVESAQEWDCKKLRAILADQNKSTLSLSNLFNRVTTFSQMNSKKASSRYFEVELDGVSSFRNQLLDIVKLRKYLSQVAPVPFNAKEYTFGEIIDNFLTDNLVNYGRFNILLNGKPIYKPYKDKVTVTKKGFDVIDDIKTFEIKSNDISIGYGWYGKRRELLGSIVKGEESSGIRVRVGNILIGDSHLLDNCFREPRFNGYVTGEIHIVHSDLIPNSRRDDFVDNEMKTLFYNAVEREIGLPISKEIRLQSRIKSKGGYSILKSETKKINNHGNNHKKDQNTTHQILEQNRFVLDNMPAKKLLNEIIIRCEDCPKMKDIFEEILKSNQAMSRDRE